MDDFFAPGPAQTPPPDPRNSFVATSLLLVGELFGRRLESLMLKRRRVVMTKAMKWSIVDFINFVTRSVARVNFKTQCCQESLPGWSEFKFKQEQ